MDNSQNKDIGRRQSLLRVAGKNAIPPQHIVEQQRRSEFEFESQTSRKIIALEHKELCPLCHCPSFIFVQPKKYINKRNKYSDNTNQLAPSIPGTFTCEDCSNRAIQLKLLEMNELKKEIKQLSNAIKPILYSKLNNKNSKYYDNKLKSKQYQETISNLRRLIKQYQNDNSLLKNKCNKLQVESNKRKKKLGQLEATLKNRWQNCLIEYKKESQLQLSQQSMNESICKQISLNKLLQITDFYKMKVLPTMKEKDNNSYEQTQLSMISNIAIPSIFKIKHIKSFYNDNQNELFRFPLPNKQSLTVTIPKPTSPYPYYNRSSSLLNYKSTKYGIPLKKTSSKSKQRNPQSPLQKYMPRLTSSISSVSEKMGIAFLTPPALKRNNINDIDMKSKPKSLPKNLDDLILPPTFFGDDEMNNINIKKGAYKQLKDGDMEEEEEKKQEIITVKNATISEPSKLNRGRSQSLDALRIANDMNKILCTKASHEPHIEHGICAALQYIVSYVLHVSKYLNIQLLYPMGLYKKNKRGKFITHTYIERKGKYFRLYWINAIDNQEFEVALHLLQENINDLCIKCGVKSSKLKYLQFIANLNTLINHLQKQQQNMNNNNNNEKNVKNKKKKLVIRKPKIEPLHIINNYGSQNSNVGISSIDSVHLTREQSTSNSISHSFSESTTAINNSESDVVISPHDVVISDHEDWDFVDYT